MILVGGNNASQSTQAQVDPTLQSDQISQTPADQTQNRRFQVKRKAMEPRLDVWNHFSKVFEDGILVSTTCNYCKRSLAAHPKRNGTTSLKNHMESCKKHPHNINTRQNLISLTQSMESSEGSRKMGTLESWEYDEQAIRDALSKFIILNELPFKLIEGIGFIYFMSIVP